MFDPDGLHYSKRTVQSQSVTNSEEGVLNSCLGVLEQISGAESLLKHKAHR